MSLEETINKLIKAVENSSRADMHTNKMGMPNPQGMPSPQRDPKPCNTDKGSNGVPAGCKCTGDPRCLTIDCSGVKYQLSDSADANCGGCCWI